MSTSYVTFDEGTSRKVRTFQRTDGVDTVEEWMYVQSESLFDTYTIYAGTIATSTVNSHLLQIMAGGSNRVGIKGITIYQSGAATTADHFPIDIHRLTTAGTGGTAITAYPLDPASSAAGATGMSLPSSKGTEGIRPGGRVRGPVETAVASATGPMLDIVYGANNTKPIYIAAGTSNGICLKNPVADATLTLDIFVTIIEADWA